ncbi:hypothetical protein JW823_02440 [bacterium]|nr:hypothetical protein [candidate division CSSED10-310 bacterium]
MGIHRNTIGFLISFLTLCIVGCSEDNPNYKLNGHWEGQNTNRSTGKQWNFEVTLEHRGNDISGVYADHRGGRTLRGITYNGESIGFLIDLWPETVTFYGLIDSRSSMSGTWSYSGDGNNGTWYLLKNQDPEATDDTGEDTTENDFAHE